MQEDLLKKDKQSRVPKDDERYRSFIGILYPDSDIYDYEEVINNLKGWCKYYAYIEHEPEKGESKKHTHFILYFDNPRFVDGVAKQLGIPKNYIQLPLSVRGSIRYLTHIDYPEKIQYDIDKVTISKSYLKKFHQAFDDEKLDYEILCDIYEFIDKNVRQDYVSLEMELSLFVCSASYNKIFKMYYNTIIKYLMDRCNSFEQLG